MTGSESKTGKINLCLTTGDVLVRVIEHFELWSNDERKVCQSEDVVELLVVVGLYQGARRRETIRLIT